MAAYYIGAYDIVDPKEFQKYFERRLSAFSPNGR